MIHVNVKRKANLRHFLLNECIKRIIRCHDIFCMGTTCSTLFYVENLHHEEKGGYETNGAHIEFSLLI